MKIFGKVLQSKRLGGAKNRTKNIENILLQASKASEEICLVKFFRASLRGIKKTEQKNKNKTPKQL